jgi:hypothetical protein
MKTLDIGEILTFEQLVALRDQGGHDSVAPYLDPFNPKGCTRQYLEDIYRAGLKLAGFFYETTGGSGQGDSYFTAAQGEQDARFAEQLLASFSGLVPVGVRVWYADDVRLVNVSAFDAYAKAIEANATAAQTPGIYGFEDLIRYAQEPVDGRAHRYPNMGPRAFLTYGDPTGLILDGWQHEQVTISGITVDTSDVYVPGWAPEEDMADETTIREWAKAEARVVLAKEYGPKLEEELQQRFADVVAKIETDLAALPSAGTSDDHIKGVVLQTVRAVFDSVAGNMPQP